MCFFTWHLLSALLFFNTVYMESVRLFVFLSSRQIRRLPCNTGLVNCTMYMAHLIGVQCFVCAFVQCIVCLYTMYSLWLTSLVYNVLYMPLYNALNMVHLIGVHVKAKGVEPSANSLSIPLFQSAALGEYFKGKAKSSKKPDQDSSLKPFKDDKPVWREGDGSCYRGG